MSCDVWYNAVLFGLVKTTSCAHYFRRVVSYLFMKCLLTEKGWALVMML